MTQLITETILRRFKIALGVLVILAVVNVVLLVAEVFILQRIQHSQDELAVSQEVVVDAAAEAAVAAIDAEASAEKTERVLSYLCGRFANLECPGVTPSTTTTSTTASVGGR